MKKLNKGEWIAVGLSLAFLAYLLFSGPLISLFNPTTSMTTDMQSPASAPSDKSLIIKDEVVGTGATAEAGDTISAHYVGTLTNGQVFDSSRDRGQPITFTLGVGQVIRGWDEGIIGMKEGGKRILTIAPEYGYGAQAVGPIPANSTLTFEVELVKVTKKQ